MRALVWDGQLHVDISVPVPQTEGDQALLKIRQAGLCNTDLELAKGYLGFSGILGHEFVAEVVQGTQHIIGQRVVGEINVACGECEFCRRGIPSQCIHRSTVGIAGHPGAFADYLALTERNLHIVPESVSDDIAVFVEPLAAALQVTGAVHVSPHDRVVVLGAGKLGMLVAQTLRLSGADLVVVVRRDKQSRLLDHWHIPSVGQGDLPKGGANVVVECTGSGDGFADALDLVKPRGVIVLKSTYAGIPQADLTRAVVDEIRVIGSRCGPFGAALRLLAAGLIDVEPLIEARYNLTQSVKAMEHASQKGVFKVLVDIDRP